MENWAWVPVVAVKVRKAHDLYRRGDTYSRPWDEATASLIVRGYLELISEAPTMANLLPAATNLADVPLANPRRTRGKHPVRAVTGADQLSADPQIRPGLG
jgi:hypothetical protein